MGLEPESRAATLSASSPVGWGPFTASAPQTGVAQHSVAMCFLFSSRPSPQLPAQPLPGKWGVSQPFAGKGLAGSAQASGGLYPEGSYLKCRQPSSGRSEAARAAGCCRRGPAAGVRGSGTASSCACCSLRLTRAVERGPFSGTHSSVGARGWGGLRAAGHSQPERQGLACWLGAEAGRPSAPAHGGWGFWGPGVWRRR